MLLAYIDEIGETGAFISKEHERFKTSPAFGYAGFIVPDAQARAFGSIFVAEKRALFKTELAATADPGRWERKGASMFRPDTPATYRQYLRSFVSLASTVKRLGGRLFYYADEKPIGTPKQTELNTEARETRAMQETLNRLCTFAESRNENLMVMIDQITEKTRAQRLPNMYGHILGRAAERSEMKRVIEPPMHVDSVLSSNIQFADWVAAAATRAIEHQVIQDSLYRWIPDVFATPLRGSFTHESKLHLWHRGVDDLNNHDLFQRSRPLFPAARGNRVGESLGEKEWVKIHAAAQRVVRRP